LEISDVMGRKIYFQKIISSKTQIDCSGFSNGIYFVRATDRENVYTQKIIIGR
jgi:hypothetical protein